MSGGYHRGDSQHLRAFAVIAQGAAHGRIPLRRTSAASFPKKFNFRKFIEKPREFIDIYRYFRLQNPTDEEGFHATDERVFDPTGEGFPVLERTARLRHHTRFLPPALDRKCGKLRAGRCRETRFRVEKQGLQRPREEPSYGAPTPQDTSLRFIPAHRKCGVMCAPRVVATPGEKSISTEEGTLKKSH